MKRFVKFYFQHKKLCLTVIGIVTATAVFGVPHIAHAQDAETAKLINSINEIILQLLKSASVLLWPVLLMIGSLLDNDLIFGGAMGDRLLGIWVQIRNLVNVIFVLILLAIAVYNVLGLGEEGGGLPLAFKTIMPKFVLALIAVNFSFLGIRLVLDFTNVITGAVFTLPAQYVSAAEFREEFKTMVCGNNSKEVPLKPMYCKGSELNDRAIAFFSKLDRSNIAIAYAVKFGRAPNLKFIKSGLKDLGQLGFNIIFNTVLYVVYAVSFIALFLVLLFRLVALWLGVVLSPLLALGIVLPQLVEIGGESGKIKEKFVKSLIAPITIGLVLSVGFIMLDGFAADKSLHGELLSSSSLSALDPNAVPTDINDLQQLMIAVGVVVVVWVGVFAAASGTVAEGLTNTMKGWVEGFGKWAAKLPTYIQAIPTGGKFGRNASLADIGATIQDIPNQTRGRSFFAGPKPDAAELNNLRTAGAQGLPQFFHEFANNPKILNSPEGWDALKTTIMTKKKMKSEEFNTEFGQSYKDLPFALQKLAHDARFKGDFDAGLKGTPLEGKSAEDIVKAIESGTDVLAKQPGEIVQGLLEGSAKAKAGKGAFTDWKAEETDVLATSLRALPAIIQETVIKNHMTEDGKVNKDILGGTFLADFRKITDAARASKAGEATVIIPTEEIGRLKRRNGPLLKAIIDGYGLDDNDRLRAAIQNPSAAAGSSATPPALPPSAPAGAVPSPPPSAPLAPAPAPGVPPASSASTPPPTTP